jgi:hypothetical protein
MNRNDENTQAEEFRMERMVMVGSKPARIKLERDIEVEQSSAAQR